MSGGPSLEEYDDALHRLAFADDEIRRLRGRLDETRESIARYFEHLAKQEIGSLIDGFTARETMAFAAEWVRNRLDEKWAAESRREP